MSFLKITWGHVIFPPPVLMEGHLTVFPSVLEQIRRSAFPKWWGNRACKDTTWEKNGVMIDCRKWFTFIEVGILNLREVNSFVMHVESNN